MIGTVRRASRVAAAFLKTPARLRGGLFIGAARALTDRRHSPTLNRMIAPAVLFAVALAATPSVSRAEEPSLSEMAEAARRALEALIGTAEPWADALSAYAADPDAYDPPQTLPNGDILIRRRTPPPPQPQPRPESGRGQGGLDL